MAEMIVELDSRLTGEQVTKVIMDFDNSQYVRNEAYHKGKNPDIILEGIRKERKNINPNNVVPLPFARRTINDLMGYAYKPGNVKYQFSEDQNEQSVETIQEILRDNQEPLESSEIFQDASIKGEGAELLFVADEKIQFSKIKREKCIFKYKDTVKQDKLEWAIRFYKTVDVQTDGKDLVTHKAEVYTDTRIDFYEWTEEKDVIQNQQRPDQRFDWNFDNPYKYITSQAHPFGDVPLYPYNINEDRLGIFQPSIPIIDKLDGFGSDSIANAIDQFNDTILTLSKTLDPEDAKKIKEWKVIDNLGGKEEGNFAEFLQRALDIDSALESTKLFERWYYELTGIPNLNDEKFGTKSGIAIAYALVPFENLVTTMEVYFSNGLKHRIDLINNALAFLNKGFEPVEITLEWQRNLPFDLKTRTEIVVALKTANLMSDETLLKMFPQNIIEDAKAEIERRQEEDVQEIQNISKQQTAMVIEPKMEVDEE
jgi:SPP1 family phage portal protein